MALFLVGQWLVEPALPRPVCTTKHSQARPTVFSVSKSERRQRRNAGKVAPRSFGIFCQPSLDKNQVKRLLQLPSLSVSSSSYSLSPFLLQQEETPPAQQHSKCLAVRGEQD
jgi:hypothetical protein